MAWSLQVLGSNKSGKVDRRKFFEKTTFGVPAFLLFPLGISSCGKEEDLSLIETDKKIVVIGGGMAGLSAARYLHQRGVSSILLEAQESLGGRTKTDRSNPLPFDLGASWIHGPSKSNPIVALADEAGVKTFLTDDESLLIYDQDGSVYKDRKAEEAYQHLVQIMEELPDQGRNDQSFGQVFSAEYPQLNKERFWKYQLSAYLEFSTGADISNLSSIYFDDDEEFSGQDLIVTNGYSTMIDHLAQDLEIRLNAEVNQINYSGEQILIQSNAGDYEADLVVVTIPLGVLKNKQVTFTPSLPAEKESALSQLEMNAINKFLCIWEDPFWDLDLQYVGYTPEQKGKFNYYLNVRKYSEINALMTFSFGNYSLETEQMSDAEINHEIMEHLRAIYGTSIPAPKSLQRTRWMADRHARGSYSFVSKGGNSSAYDQLATSVQGKLFFAGEHTSRNYRGTVHGAYISGVRAAKEIVAFL